MLTQNLPSYYPIVDLVSPTGSILKAFEPYRDSRPYALPATQSEFSMRRWYVMASTGVGAQAFFLHVPFQDLYKYLRSLAVHGIQVLPHPTDRDGYVFLYISKYHPNA